MNEFPDDSFSSLPGFVAQSVFEMRLAYLELMSGLLLIWEEEGVSLSELEDRMSLLEKRFRKKWYFAIQSVVRIFRSAASANFSDERVRSVEKGYIWAASLKIELIRVNLDRLELSVFDDFDLEKRGSTMKPKMLSFGFSEIEEVRKMYENEKREIANSCAHLLDSLNSFYSSPRKFGLVHDESFIFL